VDLIPQFDLVRQAAVAYGISQVEAPNFEADDVIATMATRALSEGLDVNVLSGDKDLMQLVTDGDGSSPSIQLIDPMKKDRTAYEQVIEKWSVTPHQLGDVLALAGDSADNVPGVKGIGPKTAAKLINEFGSLSNLLDNINQVKQKAVQEKLYAHKENAWLSRRLVELERHVPMEAMMGLSEDFENLTDLRMEVMDPDRILAFYNEMGFRQLKRHLEQRLKGMKPTRGKPSNYNRRPKAQIPKPEDFSDVPF
jgi:DNA polymerase-1